MIAIDTAGLVCVLVEITPIRVDAINFLVICIDLESTKIAVRLPDA